MIIFSTSPFPSSRRSLVYAQTTAARFNCARPSVHPLAPLSLPQSTVTLRASNQGAATHFVNIPDVHSSTTTIPLNHSHQQSPTCACIVEPGIVRMWSNWVRCSPPSKAWDVNSSTNVSQSIQQHNVIERTLSLPRIHDIVPTRHVRK